MCPHEGGLATATSPALDSRWVSCPPAQFSNFLARAHTPRFRGSAPPQVLIAGTSQGPLFCPIWLQSLGSLQPPPFGFSYLVERLTDLRTVLHSLLAVYYRGGESGAAPGRGWGEWGGGSERERHSAPLYPLWVLPPPAPPCICQPGSSLSPVPVGFLGRLHFVAVIDQIISLW